MSIHGASQALRGGGSLGELTRQSRNEKTNIVIMAADATAYYCGF